MLLRYSNWATNLVHIRKRNGEIRLYVDLENINKDSLKDNYPLPMMDYILQKVVGSAQMCMMGGFSRYNQVIVHLEGQKKIAFTTP